jgi:hypothetical protein
MWLPESRFFKFLKRDCGTIPVAEIISGKIEIFSKHQRFLITTKTSKYLLIFVLYRDIFLTLNIVHTYSLCSILKNTDQYIVSCYATNYTEHKRF